MSYRLLGQDLHDIADHAKTYFTRSYGAKGFRCEEEIYPSLPLKPTWQGTLPNGYALCIEVRETPFSETLYQFANYGLQQGKPIRLWVAVPQKTDSATFKTELRRARDTGVGVVEITPDGSVYEFHKPVPLSLLGLRKTDLKRVPPSRRAEIKDAEDTFLSGSPDKACQAICQELEDVTRKFAEASYKKGWWKSKNFKGRTFKDSFFRRDSWASMFEALDEYVDAPRVRQKCRTFERAQIAGARQFTDWRNKLSHKPRTTAVLRQRDERLRTMFEATRDLLLEWYDVVKPLRL